MLSLSGLTICLTEGQGELFQRFHRKSYDWVVLLHTLIEVPRDSQPQMRPPSSWPCRVLHSELGGRAEARGSWCSRTAGHRMKLQDGQQPLLAQTTAPERAWPPGSVYWGCLRQSLNCTRCFATLLIVACQAPLSFTISQSLLKFMSTELTKPSNHLILCRPLLRLPSVFPSVRVFSNESALCT